MVDLVRDFLSGLDPSTMLAPWEPLPHQRPPEGKWRVWFILAGRGAGKTHAGARWLLEQALRHPGSECAIVGPTIGHARDVMMEGPSGILRQVPPSLLRGGSFDSGYNRSLFELYLRNGSKIRAFGSESPGRLRGPNLHYAWGDEPAEWYRAHEGIHGDNAYSNLELALRLGEAKMLLTGTPKPNRLIREILADPMTVVTRARTTDNPYLSESAKKRLLERYAGTRLGRQELEGELLTDTPGALWRWEMFDLEGFRLDEPPPLTRVVVGVDPAMSSGPDSNETGIVVAGLGGDGHYYVLGDYSLRGSPLEWASRVVYAFDQHKADRVIAEKNAGGEMVEVTLRQVRRAIPVTLVTASRGKHTRAEPIAALYEQGRVHHVGTFPELEAQLTGWVPGEASPDRLDALVWAISALMANPAPEYTPIRVRARWG